MSAPAGSRLSTLLLVPICIGAGVLVGRQLPERQHPSDRQHPADNRVAVGASDPAGVGSRFVGVPSFAPVVERCRPAIVTVLALRRRANGAEDAATAPDLVAEEQGQRRGAGFVVDARGLVVTARHVVTGATGIIVNIPRFGAHDAQLVGEDEVTDLAVLRLARLHEMLPVLEIGRSEELQAGDWVVAVGNPFGFHQTVTAGVVSFVGRHLPRYGLDVSNDCLQFSAPVNRGSSGGPVLDLSGRVVGITTQIVSEAQGISFAIPSRTLQWVLDQLERSPDGRIRRGYLGIEFASRSGLDARGRPFTGAVVTGVAEGEPAHRAGVRPRDVVLSIDGHPIADAGELHERITRTAPGTRVCLHLLRGSVAEHVEVVLGELGAREPG